MTLCIFLYIDKNKYIYNSTIYLHQKQTSYFMISKFREIYSSFIS